MAFDSWYGSVKNLKLVHSCGWVWLTRLKSNRLVNRDRQGTQAVAACDIAASGTDVWWKGYGLVNVFRMVASNGDIGHWATNDLTMTERARTPFAALRNVAIHLLSRVKAVSIRAATHRIQAHPEEALELLTSPAT